MGQPFVLEDELGHIADMVHIKPSCQMIKFVLYDGRKKPLHFQRGVVAGRVHVIHANMLGSIHKAA